MAEAIPAFHKLKELSDADSIKTNGFKASKPAKKHWLGEGIYFFIDPNGHKWAIRWPLNKFDIRTNQKTGIFQVKLDLRHALDLSNFSVRNSITNLIAETKLKLHFSEGEKPPISDGTLFAAFFRYGLLEDLVKFVPTAIIANFDDRYSSYRIDGSRVFMKDSIVMELSETTQMQVCVIQSSIISDLTLME